MAQILQFKRKFEASLDYKAKILGMDKLELLEEMVRFQETRSRIGGLTPQLICEGLVIFSVLEHTAETNELRLLTRSYRRHLEYEQKDLRANGV